MELREERVINGTWGECWVDGDYMAEIKGVDATINMDYEDINKVRNLGTGKKLIGWEGEGSLTFHKTTSRFINLLAERLKAGRQLSVTIMTKLDDPDSIGAERIALQNVTFNDLTLANWEVKAAGEQETSFNFSDYEPLDLID